MTHLNKLLFAIAIGISSHTVAQDAPTKKLKEHITILASDKFEGRETGTKGEALSYEYIISQYKQIGLQPKGSYGYLQAFTFTRSTKPGKKNKLKINGTSYELGKFFYPLAYAADTSGAGDVVRVGYGIVAPSLSYDDYKGRYDIKNKIVVMETGTPDSGGPHSRYADFADLRTRVDNAAAKGAAGVIFINSDKELENPAQEYKNKITPSPIPVVFAKGEAHQQLLSGGRWVVEITTELVKEEATGHNVIGFINNNAINTVVIGAHYDHLGFGGDESLYRGKPEIHNGADDNASGTAALIELSRTLKASADKSNNYLFIAFSGEEKGLLGSNYFVKHPTVPLENINYMINMDMVGRLETNKPLIINGVGTSPGWKITFDYIKIDSLKIKTTDSGVGPSDHTSFYLKGIPAIHFFSGTHPDYHKPTDDDNLINYAGQLRIMDFILDLVHRLDDKGKLTFTSTKESTDGSETPRFKVTLGVVPDYAFEGAGMRIDGVTEGKPASKAGLKAGDIVIQLGDYKVTDMMSYMKALSLFKKEDTAPVKVKREKDELTFDVTF